MDFFIAILMAWLGSSPASGVTSGTLKHLEAAPKGGKTVIYSSKVQRPDPGKSYGPIIIIDDTHFKKDKEN